VNAFAILIQFGLLSPPILKAMQMDLYSLLLKGRQLIKKVEHASIINRVRNVETNNM
jgi:hypothetical protein